MAEAVQRALDNLRFDRMVKAFCVISPDNKIHQSTLDPEVEAMVQQTVSVYQGKISQLTVNTEQGLVVISKIKEDWLLAVLFPENLSLGIAVVKTKATLIALRELEINIITEMPATAKPSRAPTPTPEPVPTPPPPEPPLPSPNDEIPSLETEPALEPPPPTPELPAPTPPIPETIPSPAPAEPTPAEPTPAEPTPAEPTPAEPTPAITPAIIPSTEGRIGLAFVPHGDDALLAALDKGSPIGSQLFEKFGPYARDVLFLVDGKRDVKTIAFLLGLPEYAIVEVLEFAIDHKILAKAA